MESIKIAIVGSSGVGKTAFIERLITGDFITDHSPTTQPSTRTWQVPTNIGPINIEWIDSPNKGCPGLEPDALVLIFDLNNENSYKSIKRLYRESMSKYGQIPAVICGNKCDIRPRIIKSKHILIHRELDLRYYDVSARSLYNFEKPALALLRQFLGNKELEFQ